MTDVLEIPMFISHQQINNYLKISMQHSKAAVKDDAWLYQTVVNVQLRDFATQTRPLTRREKKTTTAVTNGMTNTVSQYKSGGRIGPRKTERDTEKGKTSWRP